MKKHWNHPLLVYGLCVTLIAGWWWIAFHGTFTPHQEPIAPIPIAENPSSLLLSSMDRTTLKQALMGDVGLMTRLIADWDTDAQLLEQAQVEGVRRLPHEVYLQAQSTGRQLVVTEQTSKGHYLPQTYVAATFLLALVAPDQLVAIPSGIRSQTDLYPLDRTSQIPIDTDRYNAELVYLAKPDVAFVAQYSHPSTLEALKNQGVKLQAIDALGTVQEIQQALLEVGQTVHQMKKAQLITAFMEAALLALDNQLLLVQSNPIPRVLYLNYYNKFSAPSTRLIAGHLAQRLGINSFLPNASADSWQIELDSEQIASLNPDALIIAAAADTDPQTHLNRHSALQSLPAMQKNQVYLVDSRTQESPTQYSVLAYFDLVQTLKEIHRNR